MAQRITSSMITNNYLRSLNNSMLNMQKKQYQMITGQKYEKFSDNPVAAIYGLQARARLARVEQYNNNCADAETWLTEAENNVMSLNNRTIEVYEEVIRLSSDNNTPEERQILAYAVKELRDHVLSVLNETLSDKYIFGGYNTTVPPYAVDENTGILCYKGIPMYSDDPAVDVSADFVGIDTDTVKFEIGFNTYMDVNVNGVRLAGLNDDNLYKILDDLYKTLTETETRFIDESDPHQGTEEVPVSRAVNVNPYIKPMQNAQSRMLMIIGELGGKTRRMEMMQERYELDAYNYTGLMSHYEDKDEADAIMEFNMAKLVYEAALTAGAQIIPLSLTNFLR